MSGIIHQFVIFRRLRHLFPHGIAVALRNPQLIFVMSCFICCVFGVSSMRVHILPPTDSAPPSFTS